MFEGGRGAIACVKGEQVVHACGTVTANAHADTTLPLSATLIRTHTHTQRTACAHALALAHLRTNKQALMHVGAYTAQPSLSCRHACLQPHCGLSPTRTYSHCCFSSQIHSHPRSPTRTHRPRAANCIQEPVTTQREGGGGGGPGTPSQQHRAAAVCARERRPPRRHQLSDGRRSVRPTPAFHPGSFLIANQIFTGNIHSIVPRPHKHTHTRAHSRPRTAAATTSMATSLRPHHMHTGGTMCSTWTPLSKFATILRS